MWSLILSFLPAVVKDLSGAKIAGVVLLVMAAMVGYHFYDEAIDSASYSALETKYAQLDKEKSDLNTKYQVLHGEAQQHAADSAVWEEKYANLWAKYDIDMKTCVIMKKKQEEEINRLKLNNKKLQDYINSNPDSGITNVIPDALIDIINGK